MTKVSIIIPVYNTEEYLAEALNSIVNQTLRDIEIIIIDDGSTDNSPSIIEHYRQTDSRICSVRQENAGQASARNTGLSKATGQYIYFMDSDDILDMDALEGCYTKAELQDLDILFFDATCFSDEGFNTKAYNYHRCNKLTDRVYTGTEISDILLHNEGFRVAPWLQIYKRSFLDKNTLKYVHTTHEDELFTIQAFLLAKRVSFIERSYFHRRLRAASVVTTSFSLKKLNAYCFIIHELNAFSKNKDSATRKLVKEFISRIMHGVIYKTKELDSQDKVKAIKRLARTSPELFSKTIFKILSNKIHG